MTTTNQQDGNLQVHPLFKISYKKTISITNFIGDQEAEILNILGYREGKFFGKEKYFNFIAKMDSGKTYSTIKMALENDLKMIFIVPLQVIAQQNYHKFSKYKSNIGFVHGKINETTNSVSVNELKKQMENGTSVFLSVYDSLSKFFDNELKDIFKPSEYILVVDESHSLITEHGYRDDSINFIRDVESKFERVLYLTGTPEGVINTAIKSYLFKKEETESRNETIELIKYKNKRIGKKKDNTLFHLFNLIINNNTDKLIVVLLDDTNSIRRLESALSAHYNGAKKIKILDSSLKNEDHYINLVKNEKIPYDINILITTRVIAEGVNIKNENVDSVYLVDLYNSYWTKRQFLGRFRDSKIKIFELHSDLNRKGFNFRSLIGSRNDAINDAKSNISYLDDKWDRATERDHSLSKETFASHKFRAMDESVYYSSYKKSFVYSLDSIINKNIRRINYELQASFSLTEKFYKDLAGFEVNVSNYESHIENETSYEEFKLLVNDFCTGDFKDNPQLFELNFTELFTVYCFEKLKSDSFLSPDIIPYMNFNILRDIKEVDRIKSCLKVENKKYLEEAYNLLADGYPKRVVVQLLIYKSDNKANFNKLLSRLSINSCISLAKKYSQYNDTYSNKNLQKEYFFALQVFNSIDPNIPISRQFEDELREKVSREFLVPKKISPKSIAQDYISALYKTKKNKNLKKRKVISSQTIQGLLQDEDFLQDDIFYINNSESKQLELVPIIKFRNKILAFYPTLSDTEKAKYQAILDEIEIPIVEQTTLQVNALKERIAKLEESCKPNDLYRIFINEMLSSKYSDSPDSKTTVEVVHLKSIDMHPL